MAIRPPLLTRSLSARINSLDALRLAFRAYIRASGSRIVLDEEKDAEMVQVCGLGGMARRICRLAGPRGAACGAALMQRNTLRVPGKGGGGQHPFVRRAPASLW